LVINNKEDKCPNISATYAINMIEQCAMNLVTIYKVAYFSDCAPSTDK